MRVGRLGETFRRWAEMTGIAPASVPSVASVEEAFRDRPNPCRPGADPADIRDWERRHGFTLPSGLRHWLTLSNGFFLDGPAIHPLAAIGPMVPFATVPELIVQPESWFELGNPNVETVCIDLEYTWPEGGHTIFTSGDDETSSRPKIISTSFESWFVELVRRGGHEYWFDPEFTDHGDPWEAHKRQTPAPALPERLRPLATRARPLIFARVDDREVAAALGLSLCDVETLVRHLQQVNGEFHLNES